ncbi:MAG TPA: cation acetate symporter, partial [Geobacteraceae bacterium]
MKKLFTGLVLALSLGSLAFAEEPKKDAAAPGAPPAATAPAAAPGAPGAPAAVVAPGAVPGAPAAAPAPAAPVKPKKELKANKAITLSMFAVIIGIALSVVVWAARKTKTAADFYAAGGGITGTQNGWAIAGDYMSAASFLGISGMISLYGYDGFMYSVGWLVAYITVLLIVAEPCRNAGKYTLGDILSFRTDPKPV